MDMLITQKKFTLANSLSFQGNYQNVLFENLDFSALNESYSFYRSDFRNAKFINSQFYKNDFDRSDFTSVYMEKCFFENSNFGNLGICNSIIKKTDFRRIKMNGAEISRTKFENCLFDGVDFLNSTVFDIDFINCEFRGCSFEKAGFENISFIDCDLKGIDFSDLTAVNFSFISSDLDNVAINLDSLGTYLFDKFNFNSLRYRYLDKNINSSKIDNKLIDNLINYLFYQNRCYEYFNIIVYFTNDDNYHQYFQKALERIISIENSYDRNENIKYLFKSIQFHVENGNILFYDLMQILDITKREYTKINNFDIFYQLKERHDYITEKIKYGFFDKQIFSDDTLLNRHSTLKLTFNLHDKNEAISNMTIIFNYFSDIYNVDYKEVFLVQNIYKGSIIVEILTNATYAMILSFIIKKTTDNLMAISINYSITKKSIALTHKIKNPKKLKDIKNLFNKFEVQNNTQDIKNAISLLKGIEIEA